MAIKKYSTKPPILRLCSEGRLSIGKAAEILDKSIYDLQRLSKEKGILLTATKEQREKSRGLLRKLP